MSSPVLGAGTHILRSHVLGSVRRVPKPAADTTATAESEAPDLAAAAAAAEVVAPSPALLMDLAEGGSLRQQIDRMRDGQGLQEPGVLSQAHAHRIVKGCLQTLDRLHAAGWVYLDLQPSNLVSLHKDEGEAALQDRKAVRDDSSEQAAALAGGNDELPGHLLVDFSSAFFLGGAEQRKHFKPMLTYTSPELLLYSIASKAADIWALGMLLLELRSGDPSVGQHVLDNGGEPGGLFNKNAHASTLQALQQEARHTAGLTETEWSFVTRCLTFDWQQRPSVRELLGDAYVVHGAGV